MGVFSRLRDIINSNVNAMLDKAENPEKLVRLMIQEMEDTLVDIKSSCSGVMANQKQAERRLELVEQKVTDWEAKAHLALDKGREDLARTALVEKKTCIEVCEALKKEVSEYQGLVQQYQEDIAQLENKLRSVREQQQILVQRHIRAQSSKQAQSKIRDVDTNDVFARFESFQNRIDRLESDAQLVNYARQTDLEDEFAQLEDDEEIEKELEDLKAKKKKVNK